MKRGGSISFDEEVANPCGAVAGNQRQREQPPLANGYEQDYAAERDRGTDKVKQTRGRLAVFSNIVWPEFREGLVPSLGHLKGLGYPQIKQLIRKLSLVATFYHTVTLSLLEECVV